MDLLLLSLQCRIEEGCDQCCNPLIRRTLPVSRPYKHIVNAVRVCVCVCVSLRSKEGGGRGEKWWGEDQREIEEGESREQDG